MSFPYWQSNFIKLFDGGLQCEFIRTFLIRREAFRPRRILVPTFSFSFFSTTFFYFVFCLPFFDWYAFLSLIWPHRSCFLPRWPTRHAWALPSMPGHNPHMPIWANFVVFGPILKISNAICIPNGGLAFSNPAQLWHLSSSLDTKAFESL